jgi:hypothetical protein
MLMVALSGLVFLAGLAVAPQQVMAAFLSAPNGGMISGVVTSPGGYPLPEGTLVRLSDPMNGNARGEAQPDLNTGAFSLGPVPNGMYLVRAVPPLASGYTPSQPKPVHVFNAPVDTGELELTLPQVLGTVVNPLTSTPVDAAVKISRLGGMPFQEAAAPGGSFALGGLPVGGYILVAYPTGDLPLWQSLPVTLSITSTVVSQTVELTLQQADLWGYTQDSSGNPVKDARVFVNQVMNGRGWDLSNEHGFWAIGGLPQGSYWLGAAAPREHPDLLPPALITVTLPGAANPYTLIFGSPEKVLQGAVTTNTGAPVFHAQVVAHRVNVAGAAEALSAADGSYELQLSPGLWAVTVKPVTDTTPSDWVFNLPPQFVFFRMDRLPQVENLDFTVITADASVSGVVVMPDGSPPPFTVTIGLMDNEGIGRRVETPAGDGSFDISLPNGGYKVFVNPQDAGYVGPQLDPIQLAPQGHLDLGNIPLLPRDAQITGLVSLNGGAPAADIPIVAWRPGIPGTLNATTGEDGQYILAVSAGTWHVQPAPAKDQPYLYSGPGQDITLVSGGTQPDVDFSLAAADARIVGTLVDEAQNPVVDAEGWAAARSLSDAEVHNGAPIANGQFTIYVPAGDYNVAAMLSAGSPYMSGSERMVSAVSGEAAPVTITLRVKDAHIVGALVDVRQRPMSQPVTGVSGMVSAWSGGNWGVAPINPGNGTYRMDVADGLWRLNYRIDPDADYARLRAGFNVTAPENFTATVPLPVTRKDGLITGTVLAPDGAPLAGALVVVNGSGPVVNGIWLETRSDASGLFSIEVPHGVYRLGAAYNQDGWIKPIERAVLVPENGISGGNVLQFRLADAEISGTLTVTNTDQGGMVLVSGWSEDGGFVRGQFPITLTSGSTAVGAYSLDVISNTTWRLKAVFETETRFWFGTTRVEVGEAGAVQDITLAGPISKPAPVVVTFDALQPQHIDLADGTSIFIPGGAMPVSGTVTLRIVPVAGLPWQRHAAILNYGYSFYASGEDGLPIEESFNQDVVISFAYNRRDLQDHHMREDDLRPVYFSTVENRWVFPQSYVIDMERNRVVMQINHFTDYILAGEQAGSFQTYLPMTNLRQ